MDLSRALPDAIILEVCDEEWVQVVDYEHVPLGAASAMNMGTYSKTSLSVKWRIRVNLTQGKIMKAFTK